MTDFLTTSMENKFSFKCPIFDQEVQMRGCVLLRDKVYRGERIATRRGCQACVSSSKCPANELVKRIAFGRHDATDHCSSEEPKTGRMPADVLERVAAVIVTETHMQTFGVTYEERELIRGAGERIAAMIETAPKGKVEARTRMVSSARSSVSRRSVSAPAPETPANHKAAATGDLSAALNA